MIDQSGQVFAPEIALHVSHNLWVTWTGLAVGHARDARAARAEGLRSGDPEAYVPEFESALQAITQVAFALDGWYGATHRALHGRDRNPNAAMSSGQLLDSLRRALGGETVRVVGFERGADLVIPSRGAAVHHQARSTIGSARPLAVGRVPDEYARYSVETAEQAINMLKAVLEGCLASPTEALQPWLEQNRGLVQSVLDLMDREVP
jgi:hypothetical protein